MSRTFLTQPVHNPNSARSQLHARNMNDSISEIPRVLKCDGSADFLAALPRLTGFTAQNSLFLVLFDSNRATQAVRLDLPPDETPQASASLLDFICDITRRFSGPVVPVSSPAIVISSAESFAESGGVPWRRLARRIKRRMRREGIGIRDLCCIAPDGWVSHLADDIPEAGRPLSEIESSPVALEAKYLGIVTESFEDLGSLPTADRCRSAAVEAACDALEPYDFPGSEHPPPASSGPGNTRPTTPKSSFVETAEVARAVDQADGPLSPELTAQLIRSTEHSDRWLLLALGLLTRPEFPGEIAREMGREHFARIPIEVDAGARFGWSIRRILTEVTPDRAEALRLVQLRPKLMATLSETPVSLRPGLYALSSWVWWASGVQTVAFRHIHAALSIDPDHELARMIERLIAAPIAAHELLRHSQHAA